MPSITDAADKNSDTLLIFLPGVRDSKEDFIERGFFSRIKNSATSVDMLAADLHIGYLEKGTGVARLYEDVINPARERGYQKIWLVGISLGGLNALLYQKKHPEDLCGVILLSPYLGDKSVKNDIAEAGGIQTWQADKKRTLNDSESLWSWLKTANLDKVYLGTGASDRFIYLQQQLARLLPEGNTHIIEGKHRWTSWNRLWQFYVSQFEQNKLLDKC